MPAVAKARAVAPLKDLYGIGEIPPLGHVPEKMHAWVSARSGTVLPTNLSSSKSYRPGRSPMTRCSSTSWQVV